VQKDALCFQALPEFLLVRAQVEAWALELDPVGPALDGGNEVRATDVAASPFVDPVPDERQIVQHQLFDVLGHEGQDFTSKPVLERRERLSQLISPVNDIQVGSWIPTRGQDLLSEAKEKGLEGIVDKRIESIYLPGQRTKD
jgi:hypothetical protein